ncbi:MAG: (2Fe-2S) ferredoxin domain-containing protein, partial [Candidatus Saccharicenans sp.]
MNQKIFRIVQELRSYRQNLQMAKKPEKLVSVSAASCGRASGALEVASAFSEAIKKFWLESLVEVRLTGCHGFCQFEPNVVIFPGRIFYPNLSPDQVPLIVEETLIKGRVVSELAFR